MRVQVGDVRLYFDVDGAQLVPDGTAMRERPTLLLLHGGPGFDHTQFKPQFEQLRDVVQIVYLDHRDNGRSDRVQADRCSLERWGDDVRAFCDALEIRRPIVLGVSFGGFVAQAYATRHPDHPGALILCNTSARHRGDRASTRSSASVGVRRARWPPPTCATPPPRPWPSTRAAASRSTPAGPRTPTP